MRVKMHKQEHSFVRDGNEVAVVVTCVNPKVVDAIGAEVSGMRRDSGIVCSATEYDIDTSMLKKPKSTIYVLKMLDTYDILQMESVHISEEGAEQRRVQLARENGYDSLDCDRYLSIEPMVLQT